MIWQLMWRRDWSCIRTWGNRGRRECRMHLQERDWTSMSVLGFRVTRRIRSIRLRTKMRSWRSRRRICEYSFSTDEVAC
jgi:hypothetical protein